VLETPEGRYVLLSGAWVVRDREEQVGAPRAMGIRGPTPKPDHDRLHAAAGDADPGWIPAASTFPALSGDVPAGGYCGSPAAAAAIRLASSPSSTRRTSTEPLRALGIFAAHSIAASTDSTSIKK
jgi:hypothetical protein